jgi:outer membrane protein, heavy metal efflux system
MGESLEAPATEDEGETVGNYMVLRHRTILYRVSTSLRVLVALACVIATEASAQGPLTLADAVVTARAAGPWRDVAGARGALTRGTQRLESQLPNPVLEYRRERNTPALMPDEFREIALPLDLTGRRVALVQAGRAAARRAAWDSAAVRLELEHGVAEAWIEATLATALAEAALAQAAALDSLAVFDAARFREGAVAEVASLRTRVESDRAALVAAAARGAAARARAALAVWVGAAVGATAPLTSAALDAPPPRDALLERATRARPDARAAQEAATQAALRRTAERRGILGDIQLVGGLKTTSGVANTGLIGVIVPMPLFNQNGGARDVTAAESRIASAEALALALRVDAEVRAAHEAWEAVAALGEAAVTLAPRADDVAAIARATYREGASTLTAVLEAQRAAFDIRVAAAEGLAARLRASLALRAAVGLGPLDPWSP